MADNDPKADVSAKATGVPGSASNAHPTDAIPLPDHGFDTLDDVPLPDLTSVSAAEVITRAAVLLLSTGAQKLGVSPDSEPDVDLDEARRLITALAGLLAASQSALGDRWDALLQGLTSLQSAFREASRYPDEPGAGPGEQYLP